MAGGLPIERHMAKNAAMLIVLAANRIGIRTEHVSERILDYSVSNDLDDFCLSVGPVLANAPVSECDGLLERQVAPLF